MIIQGLSETYVGSFCGRVPKSVLSRYYTDFSARKLNKIFLNAQITICECKKEVANLRKWKYSAYDVESYLYECGTDFRSYKIDGIEKFKLKRGKTDKYFRKP